MRSDYIVPEASSRRGPGIAPRLIVGAVVLGGVLLAAGQFGTTGDGESAAAEEIQLVSSVASGEARTQRASSLLQDLAPISQAQAKAAPLQSQTLPELPLVDDLPASRSAQAPAIDRTADANPGQVAETPSAPPETPLTVKRLRVASGDSLSALFDRHRLPSADWIALSRLDGEARRLRRLRPGDELEVALNGDDQVMRLTLALDELTRLRIERNADGGFSPSVVTDSVETRAVTAEGVIENSLFLSAKSAGLSDRLTMELTDIFAWDIDFVLDIRGGDSFRVIYEEIWRDGEKVKDGDILAAEFVNRGNAIQAVRYTDSDERVAYYSPAGEPMKKAFLRSPVDFTRISSRFSLGRKHPILNKIRAHRGVDYAAPGGTPIKSAGSGKVVFAGRKGGYGNVVIVQHAGKYKTLYAHMRSFRRGIRRGVSVNQGQTVGYVGMSGLATGPHLHYEFLINDRHVNPLTVKLPSAPPIADSELARFKGETEKLLAQLQAWPQGTEVADAR